MKIGDTKVIQAEAFLVEVAGAVQRGEKLPNAIQRTAEGSAGTELLSDRFVGHGIAWMQEARTPDELKSRAEAVLASGAEFFAVSRDKLVADFNTLVNRAAQIQEELHGTMPGSELTGARGLTKYVALAPDFSPDAKAAIIDSVLQSLMPDPDPLAKFRV